MDKLVFIIPKPKVAAKETQIMRVSKDFYNLANEISTATGIPCVKITERISEFLEGKVIFKEMEDKE